VSLIRNLRILYPIFPTVAILLRKLLPDLSEDTRNEVFDVLRDLISQESHILMVPANLSFAIRIIAYDRAEETDVLLNEVYLRPTTNMMVKRDVLLAMTRRGADYWLSQQVKRFPEITPWERRALLLHRISSATKVDIGGNACGKNSIRWTKRSCDGSAGRITAAYGTCRYDERKAFRTFPHWVLEYATAS
jgi:hypothetical protein